MKRIALALVILGASGSASTAVAPRTPACIATPTVLDAAPPDPNVISSGASWANLQNWYVNDDRTIWAGPVPSGGWPAGGYLLQRNGRVNGQKTYWVKPWGSELRVTVRRADGGGRALEMEIPCCYRTGFQIVPLYFPAEGCWEVLATAGDRQLRFVTEVTWRDPRN